MNAHKLIAAALAAATLPFVPACTLTTAGRADLDRVEWLEDYDQKAAATVSTSAATADPAPQMPTEYEALGAEIDRAVTGIKDFWHRQGVDLSAVIVTMVDNETHAPCPSSHGVAVADGWTCDLARDVVVYLPLLQKRAKVGGVGYVRFLVGHEIGHVVASRRSLSLSPAVEESLADCLSGAAAAGSGTAVETQRAVDAVYPSDSARHNSVTFGIERGYRACISVAK